MYAFTPICSSTKPREHCNKIKMIPNFNSHQWLILKKILQFFARPALRLYKISVFYLLVLSRKVERERDLKYMKSDKINEQKMAKSFLNSKNRQKNCARSNQTQPRKSKTLYFTYQRARGVQTRGSHITLHPFVSTSPPAALFSLLYDVILSKRLVTQMTHTTLKLVKCRFME